MAVTIANLADEGNASLGPFTVSVITLTGDASYPTGGYTSTLGFTAANCNCGRGINGVVLAGWNTAAEGYIPALNTTTGNLQIFTGTAGTPAGTISGNVVITAGTLGEAIGVNPVSNSGALSAASGSTLTIPYATFLGGALTFTGTPGAAGALAELGNATDIHTFTWTLFVIGQR